MASYSDVDQDSLHVYSADEAIRVGPPPARLNYLNAPSSVDVVLRCGVQWSPVIRLKIHGPDCGGSPVIRLEIHGSDCGGSPVIRLEIHGPDCGGSPMIRLEIHDPRGWDQVSAI
ncbi:hypothetical protein RIF29_10423 [Crotalaria pallida]|uniref:Uncharacterized protein n=1 Tax=Crotalaria pallida TaxID=3830 RepID=A0AAN9FVR4_CROPI